MADNRGSRGRKNLFSAENLDGWYNRKRYWVGDFHSRHRGSRKKMPRRMKELAKPQSYDISIIKVYFTWLVLL
jgi:hypothetical protein